MTDIASWLDGTHHEIGHRRIAAGEARTALIGRRYDAPIDDVWDACTNPDRLRRWFLPVTGELRVGGRFSLQENASGEILRCEPPTLLAVTWVYGDRPADEVELRLTAGEAGDTLLELEHATVSDQVEWDGRVYDAILGLGTGWDPAIFALDAYLTGDLPVAELSEWQHGTPPADVMELFRRSGALWNELVASSR